MSFLFVIAAGFATYFAFKTNIYVGLIVTLFILVYATIKFIPFMYEYKSRKALAMGNFADAKNFYKKALKNSKYSFKTQMEYVYIILRTGDFEEALDTMNKLLACKMEPQNRNLAIIQRCMCYYKTGDLDSAYNDALELYNDDYKTVMLYGLLGYFKILKAPLSDDTFEFCLEAYDYADDDRDICDNLLICYYNRGDYEKAKEISDAIIETNPKFVEAWYHAAQIDVALNDYKSAREKLDKISECNRSLMTTIPEEDVEKLSDSINQKLKEKI